MTEAVRLVVWDLDETFWKGTLTEGGIREYVRAHHDIVIELAKRGIMSSICSKNDRDTVLALLEQQGIRDYFIFPSISWDPKGMRLAQLVEAVQLRAPTVMFIDDNANNRGEAQALVPGIQVEDEHFIARMLADPRFTGKNDADLTRLKQYRLLEQRKQDEQSTAGSNEDFLRGCEIQVYIEHDVDAHIDRAVELVNRTNQLNYTKRRLPEDPVAAREELRRMMTPFDVSAGLVRVRDKYGDYGFVGFFMTGGMRKELVEGAANTHLIHFCFSCRTLGMLIEQWTYERLGRPELAVVGEVLTDLSVKRTIDWVRAVATPAEASVPTAPVAERLVLWGGCETAAMSAYLAHHATNLEVFGNYIVDEVFVSANYVSRVLDRFDRDEAAFAEELKHLGLPAHLELDNPFTAKHGPALFVVNLGDDAKGVDQYRHKVFDWSVRLAPNGLSYDFFSLTDEAEIERQLSSSAIRFDAQQLASLHRLGRHLRDHYDFVNLPSQTVGEVIGETRVLLGLVPQGCKIIIISPHSEERTPEDPNAFVSFPRVAEYMRELRELVAEFPYAGTIAFADMVKNRDEMRGGNHFARPVYHRMSQAIVEMAGRIEPRADKPVSKRRLERLAAGREEQRRFERMTEFAGDLVDATFEVLLRRPVEPEKRQHESRYIAGGSVPGGWFIRAVSKSEEFAAKWAPKVPGEDAARASLIDFPSLRIPSELTLTPMVPRRVLLVGSCLSESIKGRMKGLPDPCEGELYFVGSQLPKRPERPLAEYDFQIVQLALRFLLPDGAFGRLGQLDEAGHQALFDHTVQGMRRHLDMAMQWNREHGLLTFVLPFIEPVQNPIGRLMPRFDLRNPVYFIERLNEAMARELAQFPNAFFVDLNQILGHHGRRFSQEDVFMSINHGGFLSNFDAPHDLNRLEPAGRASDLFEERISEFFAALWRELVGLYRTVSQIDPVKLVIVDLDDTMWRGVMAEAEPDNLPTSEGWPLGLWEALLMLKRRGVMLAILSKNEEARVDELWPKVFGRRLQPDDFAIRKINWNPKAENMAEILSYVNLLPRNVLYIDDNPVERAAVQSAFPDLRVLGGSPLQWRRILLWAPETQVAHITAESAARTDMMRAQVEREDQRKTLSRDEFLASLDVSLSFFEVDSTDHPRFPRVHELVNKTNQFNTTGRRWSREEFVTHFAQGHAVFAFEVEDRYTQYGLVGVLIVVEGTIVQFVMSCRVLGLGVEQAVLSLATETMVRRGAAAITGRMIETDRNQPCRELYAHCGFQPIEGGWFRPAEPRLPIPPHVKASSAVRDEALLTAAQ